MWCCRMTEKIRWTDRVENEEELHGVKKYTTYDNKTGNVRIT